MFYGNEDLKDESKKSPECACLKCYKAVWVLHLSGLGLFPNPQSLVLTRSRYTLVLVLTLLFILSLSLAVMNSYEYFCMATC